MAYRAYVLEKHSSNLSIVRNSQTVAGEIVIQLVSDYFNTDMEQMKRVSRVRDIVWPRQVCMYLMAYYTPISLREIGELFNGKDHTTVIHSKDTVRDLMDSDPAVREQINFLVSKIERHAETKYQAINGSDSIYPGHA